MRTVYKYPLQPTFEPQQVRMPSGARILHVASQAGGVCVWALVDIGEGMNEWTMLVVGTGHPMPDGEWHHVGTVHRQTESWGELVLHVFAGWDWRR